MVECSKCQWYAGGLTNKGRGYKSGDKCPECGKTLDPIEVLDGLLDDDKPYSQEEMDAIYQQARCGRGNYENYI